MILVTVRESHTRVMGQPGRAVRNVYDRGDHVGGLTLVGRVPDLFPVEGAAVTEVLVIHSPAGVAPLDDVDPAGLVTAVGIIIACEEISIIVERQFLRITQAVGEFLEFSTVQVATKDGSRIRAEQVFAFFGGHVISAVADTEVEASVGAEHQAMQVVTAKGDANAVTAAQFFPQCCFAFVGGVAQFPDVRDAGVIDITAPGQHTRAGSVFDIIESIGKDTRMVGSAVAIAVFHQPNPVVLPCVIVDFVFEVFPEISQPIFDGFCCQIVVQPVHVSAVVLNSFSLAEGFSDVEPALFINAEGDRIGQQGLGGKQADLHSLRNAETLDRLFAFLGSFRDGRRIGCFTKRQSR